MWKNCHFSHNNHHHLLKIFYWKADIPSSSWQNRMDWIYEKRKNFRLKSTRSFWIVFLCYAKWIFYLLLCRCNMLKNSRSIDEQYCCILVWNLNGLANTESFLGISILSDFECYKERNLLSDEENFYELFTNLEFRNFSLL